MGVKLGLLPFVKALVKGVYKKRDARKISSLKE
jgi:hypothetical protein